jgi:nucleoside-diphosphate-sugar epimerase
MEQTVLLLGGTGRTGGRVLQQLLARGIKVRAIVRSTQRLPVGLVGASGLTLVEAELLALSQQDLQRQLNGCSAVVSCLGHTISLKGVFGSPRDLVTQATTRLCRAIQALRPARPIRFVLMSSVSVNRPNRLDAARPGRDRALLALIRGLVPPAKDNQRAADFLWHAVGPNDPFVEWAAVRPDTLVQGEVTRYDVHEGIVSRLFKPASTSRANVAHFICELVTNPAAWHAWRSKLPVIVNSGAGLA